MTGSVAFQDRDWLFAGLDMIHTHPQMDPISEIVEGGRPGTDVRAQEWAHKREVRCLTVPIQWALHGPGAEFEQHTQMAKLLPKIVLATPCANEELLAIHRAYQLKVVKLEKMPVVRSNAGAP